MDGEIICERCGHPRPHDVDNGDIWCLECGGPCDPRDQTAKVNLAPNYVLTWAIAAAGGTGEEGEWNVYFPDDGQTDHYAQVWADNDAEPDVAIVGVFTLDFGIEQRFDLKPHEARQLAAALLCAASQAEDRVAMWREDGDA